MKTRLHASGGISCSYKFTASGYLTNKLYSNGVRAQYFPGSCSPAFNGQP